MYDAIALELPGCAETPHGIAALSGHKRIQFFAPRNRVAEQLTEALMNSFQKDLDADEHAPAPTQHGFS
ncbi:hypothetical protein [Zoogloea sp. LCSB751]|uniref:hypothetical protein n=1 Tax=Zoogloea sp. LCSB751 TaxID=1965277 RepID=UPI001116C4B3|nr:hypothetical protein [Zoogloea sp. LCSB751]